MMANKELEADLEELSETIEALIEKWGSTEIISWLEDKIIEIDDIDS